MPHNAKIDRVKLADGQYRSSYGLVHRDIKPQNILLSNLGSTFTIKNGDFGLAKAYRLAGFSGYN